jgi:2-keto-4-pentenoate hydratase/2-oxohepta-3-ene-1,7-dioic acid hydratase in catechol pathway
LLPGTLILTGTPSGVGEARDPKRFLVPGDEVTVEIDGVGILTNPVVEEVFGEEDQQEGGKE